MQQRQLGGSGLRVSRMGLGTLTWGRDTDEHEALDQLGAFRAAGGNLVDTAAGFGDGAAEQILGRLWPQVGSRADFVLCTRPSRARLDPAGTSRRAMIASLEQSLRRLGTDHVDLWLVQAWSQSVPLDETLSALEFAVTTGRARYIGVSDFTGWQSARAAALHQVRGATPLVAQQSEYSLVARQAESEILPAAAGSGLGMLVWSPLGRGVLTGKYRKGIPADSRAASAHLAAFVEPYLDARCRRIVDALGTAATGLGCTPAEVALAWVRDQPGVTAPLVGARTSAQLQAVLTSEAVELPQLIREALDEVSDPA